MSTNQRIVKTLHYKADLDPISKDLLDSPYHIMFHNVLSELKIGNREISEYYSNAYVGENVTVLIPDNGSVSADIFQKCLNRKVPVNEVSLLTPVKERKGQKEKKVQFVNSEEDLESELRQRVFHEDMTCIYYPKMKGSLKLSYELESGEKGMIEKDTVFGVLEFGERILAITDQELVFLKVLKALNDKNIFEDVDWGLNLPYFENQIASSK